MLYHATFGCYVPEIEKEGILSHADGNASDNWGWGDEFGDMVFLSDDEDVAASYCECADNVPDEVYDSGIYIVAVDLDSDGDDVERDPFTQGGTAYAHRGSIPPEHIVGIHPYDG